MHAGIMRPNNFCHVEIRLR